jgi:hypothetical protein
MQMRTLMVALQETSYTCVIGLCPWGSSTALAGPTPPPPILTAPTGEHRSPATRAFALVVIPGCAQRKRLAASITTPAIEL